MTFYHIVSWFTQKILQRFSFDYLCQKGITKITFEEIGKKQKDFVVQPSV